MMQKPAAAGISWIVCTVCAKRSSDETSPPCARMAGFDCCFQLFGSLTASTMPVASPARP